MDAPPGNRDGKEGDAAKASEDATHDLAQGRNPPEREPINVLYCLPDSPSSG